MYKRHQLKTGCVAAITLIFVALTATPSTIASHVLSIQLNAGEYQIVNRDEGQVIEVEGFGYLAVPGKPSLPAKNFLIALPPGAHVRSVEVKGTGATQLPGRYQIIPTPPVVPLVDPQQFPECVNKARDEWQRNNQAVYLSDEAYPSERGKLTGSGGLRKYAYASVSFYPFSYHPQSGRLIQYDAAQININYDLPSPGSPEAQKVEELRWDTAADERASRLFTNFEEVRGLYQPAGTWPKAPEDTYDYVIITTSVLQSAVVASNFLDWKASLGYNVRFVLTTDTEITSQPGVDFGEQIRNFLRGYYLPWGIEYVLFGW